MESVSKEVVSKAFLEKILGSLKAVQERQNKQEEQMQKLTQTNQGQLFQIPQELMMKLLLKWVVSLWEILEVYILNITGLKSNNLTHIRLL